MTVVAIIEAVALVAVVALFLRDRAQERAQNAQERRELLTRIQHPEIVVTEPRAPLVLPEPEPDDSFKVGVAFHDD